MENCFMPKFEKRGGLVTVITQDVATREVLMVAYANREAYVATLLTLKATYWSTSRKKLWVKGEESGNTQEVVDVLIDCDGDALVYLVRQVGDGACHTGARSCFYRSCIDALQLMDAPKAGPAEMLPVIIFADEKEKRSISSETKMEHGGRLRFLLPTGSLADAVRSNLKAAGYDVSQPDRRGFCGICNGIEFHQLDRRTIPKFLETGLYDAGITGRDLLIASGVRGLTEVCALSFSRSSDEPTRWVLAKRKDWQPIDGKETVIGCELPHFAEEILASVKLPFAYRIRPIYGSEEQCVRDGIVDMVLVITETGSSITANNLEILSGCEALFESTPVIMKCSSLGRYAECQLEALSAALRSALGAKRMVMVVFNLSRSIEIASLILPSVIAPTVSSLLDHDWYSCTICIPLVEQGRVLTLLENAGARGITVLPVQGYIA